MVCHLSELLSIAAVCHVSESLQLLSSSLVNATSPCTVRTHPEDNVPRQCAGKAEEVMGQAIKVG